MLRLQGEEDSATRSERRQTQDIVALLQGAIMHLRWPLSNMNTHVSAMQKACTGAY